MLSDKRQILQLVSLMAAHGITDVVLCPGSRNAPICHTISQLSLFQCHAVTDERSAGFFAIGLALATHRTVAVCVTSGSALLNLHPAVAEAYYQQVPLLVISADRPQAWIGQMDGQTMPQPQALQGMTKMSVDLPEVHTDEEAWFCNRLINEAILACTHRALGPVHINVPISEPLYVFQTDSLPEERVIRRIEGLYPEQLRQLTELLQGTERRMIILGQKPADRQVPPSYMEELRRGFVSLCEHLANADQSGSALLVNDALMDEVEQNPDYQPDLVITLCGHIVNKRLKQYLRKHPPRQHWHVSADGSVADLFGCLTTVVEARPFAFLQALSLLMIPLDENGEFPALWCEASQRSTAKTLHRLDSLASLEPLDHLESLAPLDSLAHLASLSPLDSLAHLDPLDSLDSQSASLPSLSACDIVGLLMRRLPDEAVLHLANSSSVRYAQCFPLNSSVTVCCNRGINGIEGSLSAAVGFATATPERPNYVIIGDLSFFYDQNALWNRNLPDNLHILLLNSGGGQIFSTLPVPDDDRSRSFICASQHFTAQHVAAQYGLLYLKGVERLDAFLQSSQRVLLEV